MIDFFSSYYYMRLQFKNMSNYGRRQLSANEKAFKYQFNLQILKFKCQFPLKTAIKFMWKRNNKSIQTKSLIDVPTGKQEITVNQKLSSISTIIFNTQKKQFLGKQSELIVNMYFGGSPKKLASCHIDMKNILDPNNYKANRSQTFQIPTGLHVKNTINDSKILFRLSSIYKEEIILSEKSIGTASLNMSGLSIPQDHKYYEKRYDVIPSKDSKDTHSVNSYNPVSRYPSANKRERDDSSSIRKHQFGYFNNTLKNNNSNNDFETKSALKSIDNKTDMNDGNYGNKLLIEQQTKRSKAQAQLTKNKIQIQSLKKKINEFMIQNMKLKEQIGLLNQQSGSKQEISNLQQRLYETGNDLRLIKSQIQSQKYEKNRIQNQFSKVKNQKMALQSQLLAKQRKIQDLQRNQVNLKIVQSIQNQKSNLKYELDNIKKYIQQYKKQVADKQNRLMQQKSREIQELNSKIQLLKKQNDKSKINQSNSEIYYKKYLQIEIDYKNKLEDLTLKTKRNIELQREVEQCHNRLTRYQSEKYSIQYELKKIKEEAVDRVEYEKQKEDLLIKCENLQFENKKFVEQLLKNKQILENNLQLIEHNKQLIENKQKFISKIQQEKGMQQGKIKNLLSQINQLQKKCNDKDLELTQFSENLKRLQIQKNHLKQQIPSHKIQQISRKNTQSTPQADILFRQNLQLKIEIKFAYDQLNRLKMIEEQFNQQKYIAQRYREQKEAIEAEFQKLQKQLKNKNLALLLENSKINMMSEQANHYVQTIEQLKNELNNTKAIISNGQEQLNQLQAYINQLQNINKILQSQNNQFKNSNIYLNSQLNNLKNAHEGLSNINAQLNNYNNQLKNQNKQILFNSQIKLKQLQQRNNQKLNSLQLMNKNINTANQQIKELQKLNQERQNQLFEKQKIIGSLENRCKQIQNSKMVHQSQYNKLINDKKLLQKRNEMIMQEIHFMKKKYEQEKGRSLSLTRNEQNNKVRGLQMELQKKEKAISKLNKQKLQMQEQNVKLNILNMKYLNEIQKFKTNPNGPSYSFKSISSVTKS